MNEIKVNKPLQLIKDKSYQINIRCDMDDNKWWDYAKFTGYSDMGSAIFYSNNYGVFYMEKEYINSENIKDDKDLQEITRLQQLAGINEIKINNPIVIKPEDMIPGQKYTVEYYYDGEEGNQGPYKDELIFKKSGDMEYDYIYMFVDSKVEDDRIFLYKHKIIKVNQI